MKASKQSKPQERKPNYVATARGIERNIMSFCVILGLTSIYYYATNTDGSGTLTTLLVGVAFLSVSASVFAYGSKRFEFFPDVLNVTRLNNITRRKKITSRVPYFQIKKVDYPESKSRTRIVKLTLKSGSEVSVPLPSEKQSKPGLPFSKWLEGRIRQSRADVSPPNRQ